MAIDKYFPDIIGFHCGCQVHRTEINCPRHKEKEISYLKRAIIDTIDGIEKYASVMVKGMDLELAKSSKVCIEILKDHPIVKKVLKEKEQQTEAKSVVRDFNL